MNRRPGNSETRSRWRPPRNSVSPRKSIARNDLRGRPHCSFTVPELFPNGERVTVPTVPYLLGRDGEEQ